MKTNENLPTNDGATQFFTNLGYKVTEGQSFSDDQNGSRKSFDSNKVFPLKSISKVRPHAGALCVICYQNASDSTHQLKGQRVCNKCAETKTNLDK